MRMRDRLQLSWAGGAEKVEVVAVGERGGDDCDEQVFEILGPELAFGRLGRGGS